VVTNSYALFHLHARLRVRLGIRLSLRPLHYEGRRECKTQAKSRREDGDSCLLFENESGNLNGSCGHAENDAE
jgi:hypothetical protein